MGAGGGSKVNMDPILGEDGEPLDPKSEEYKKIKAEKLAKIKEEKAMVDKKMKEEKAKLD